MSLMAIEHADSVSAARQIAFRTTRHCSVALSIACLSLIPVSAHAYAVDVNEALALLDAWQLEDALSIGERVLLERPQDPEVWMLTGRLQLYRGAHRAALSFFDAAADAGVEVGYVHALVRNTAGYEAHFQALETDHFRIHYLNKDEIVAYHAKAVLEAAYKRIGTALDIFPAERGEKIIVEIFPDARGLAGATGLTVQEIGTSGTIAVCKFHRLMITSPLATASGYDWADTLAHEYTHLLITKKSHNSIPIWLHEGIAKYYESMWSGKPGRALGPYAETLLAKAVKAHTLITYDEMHPSMAKLPSQEATALAFAEVFTTIEFMRERFGTESVPHILQRTGAGEGLERALRAVTQLDLHGIEKVWTRWLRGRSFKLVAGAKPQRIELSDRGEAKADKEKPLEAIADKFVHDHSRLGELLQLRDHHEAAVVEYEQAHRKAGVKYASLNYRLARAYQKTGKDDEALRLLDETLLAHNDDGDLHVLAGRMRLKRGDLKQAKQHFERVILRNPFNPETHAALALLYDKAGDKAAAQLAQHFFELSRQPRPRRDYGYEGPEEGDAWLTFLPKVWDAVQLTNHTGTRTEVQAPYLRFPVAEGAYRVEFSDGAIVDLNLQAQQTREVTHP